MDLWLKEMWPHSSTDCKPSDYFMWCVVERGHYMPSYHPGLPQGHDLRCNDWPCQGGHYMRHIFSSHSSWKGDIGRLWHLSKEGASFALLLCEICFLKSPLINEYIEKCRVAPLFTLPWSRDRWRVVAGRGGSWRALAGHFGLYPCCYFLLLIQPFFLV